MAGLSTEPVKSTGGAKRHAIRRNLHGPAKAFAFLVSRIAIRPAEAAGSRPRRHGAPTVHCHGIIHLVRTASDRGDRNMRQMVLLSAIAARRFRWRLRCHWGNGRRKRLGGLVLAPAGSRSACSCALSRGPDGDYSDGPCRCDKRPVRRQALTPPQALGLSGERPKGLGQVTLTMAG
jgi:hypothetical protein